MKNFRTLTVAKEFHRKARHIKLTGAFKNQFERALLSVPLNLVEGTTKPSPKERRVFYYRALGSLREVQMILELTNHEALLKESDCLAAHLYQLCKKTT
jgi:four helix bundle protein